MKIPEVHRVYQSSRAELRFLSLGTSDAVVGACSADLTLHLMLAAPSLAVMTRPTSGTAQYPPVEGNCHLGTVSTCQPLLAPQFVHTACAGSAGCRTSPRTLLFHLREDNMKAGPEEATCSKIRGKRDLSLATDYNGQTPRQIIPEFLISKMSMIRLNSK